MGRPRRAVVAGVAVSVGLLGLAAWTAVHAAVPKRARGVDILVTAPDRQVYAPGDEMLVTVRLENEADRARKPRIKLRVRGKSNTSRALRGTRSRWVPATVPLEPGEIKDVEVRVRIPDALWGPIELQNKLHARDRNIATQILYVDRGEALRCPEKGRVEFEPLLSGPGYELRMVRLPTIEPRTFVLQSDADWAAMVAETRVEVPQDWSRSHLNADDSDVLADYSRTADVDFANEMALAIFAGIRGPAELGSYVCVDRIRLDGSGALECEYRVKEPRKPGFGFPDPFSPFLIVVLPRCEFDKIVFRRRGRR